MTCVLHYPLPPLGPLPGMPPGPYWGTSGRVKKTSGRVKKRRRRVKKTMGRVEEMCVKRCAKFGPRWVQDGAMLASWRAR